MDPVSIVSTNRVVLAAGLLFAVAQLPAQSGAVVSPADRGGLEGSTSTIYPLGRFDCRYQQLHDDLGKARVITGHAYRRDALSTRTTIQAFKTSIAVRLSVAALTAAKISATFADNIGASPTTVLPRTLISFPATTRPTTIPAKFEFRIPYLTNYLWQGAGTLCTDIVIDGNQLATGSNRTFSPSLDAQQLYTGNRNLQPGYRYGAGCVAPGQTRAATAIFEIRHLGKRVDLAIDARYGVPSTASVKAHSALLLSLTKRAFPWPGGSGCTVYGDSAIVLPLAGDNSSTGGWQATILAGLPPAPGFEMIGQILSHAATGAVVLSDASRLIMPPAGVGVVSSRVVSASDRTATTGSRSFSIPITEFR